MAELFKDGFDHYGQDATGAANMLAGPYAQVSGCTPGVPSWGARTGTAALSSTTFTTQLARRVLPSAKTALICAFGYSVPSLPGSNNNTRAIEFRDGSNNTLFYVSCQSTGTLALLNAAGSVVVQTAGPVIVSKNWHFIEMKIDITGATFRLDVDGDTVINGSSLALGATSISQIVILSNSSGTGGTQWMDDLIVRDTSGTRNNGFEGDLRVAVLYPDADTAVAGWTAHPRAKFGTGILDLTPGTTAAPSAITVAQTTALNLGAGDYTLETFVRFLALPTTTNYATIFSKWGSAANARSYELYVGGPSLEAGNTVFRISTDGLAGTVTELISYPWAPQINTWYHIALVRASGETMLFINGIQLGLPVADANTYFAASTVFAVGAETTSTGGTVANAGFDGFMDETRVTVGVARYTANFTPPAAPFPRSVAGGDPNFANVQFLAGYDSAVADESSFARAVTVRNSAARFVVDDGTFSFQDICLPVPRDDTYVGAALIAATNIFTLSGQPANTETVRVGTKDGVVAATYTFKTVLASAFDVLIGANAVASLANLVAAITAAAGAGTLYGTGTTANFDVTASTLPATQILVTALGPGTAGNAIVSTETVANGSWASATLTGGANIPGPSQFLFQRLPPLATVIKSVSLVVRAFKSDSGTCRLTSSFVGPLNTAAPGADNPLTLTPTYYMDTFETDPDTGNDITPSTIIGGKIQLNRTA